MNVHLINPSSVSFGTAVITPRWQYVLAAATPKSFGDPILVDETLFQMDPNRIQPGDAVGIGIHTANALRTRFQNSVLPWLPAYPNAGSLEESECGTGFKARWSWLRPHR